MEQTCTKTGLQWVNVTELLRFTCVFATVYYTPKCLTCRATTVLQVTVRLDCYCK